MARQRMQIVYSGHVQGVGFRYSVKMLVRGFEVTGMVRNLPDGRVELVAEGEREELDAFAQAVLESEVGSLIHDESRQWSAAKNEFSGFQIVT
jgi:acylphosphatase